MSSTAVAVVLGAAELTWLDWGFPFPGTACSPVAYRGRDVWMMVWLAAACFVEAAFIFSACLLPGTNLLGVGSRHGSPHVGR